MVNFDHRIQLINKDGVGGLGIVPFAKRLAEEKGLSYTVLRSSQSPKFPNVMEDVIIFHNEGSDNKILFELNRYLSNSNKKLIFISNEKVVAFEKETAVIEF